MRQVESNRFIAVCSHNYLVKS